MKQFLSLLDVPDLSRLIEEGLDLAQNPSRYNDVYRGKAAAFIFLNPSLRTRLSSQRAAQQLGMHASLLDIDQHGWNLSFDEGVIMNGVESEHVKEAASVLGSYFDVIGIRSFATLKNREQDNQERILSAFSKYAGVPIINLESATGHPLQALSDVITIRQHQRRSSPKIVLTWAPHPKALPQAVANSFAEWILAAGYDLHIAHPPGYDLDARFTKGARISTDQDEALEGAHFVYVKNWSATEPYGSVLNTDPKWSITPEKMRLTNKGRFMHCLPVRRNVVVSDAVIDHPSSLHLAQAQNRLVSAKLILHHLLKSS